jgi:hypothetical protein
MPCRATHRGPLSILTFKLALHLDQTCLKPTIKFKCQKKTTPTTFKNRPTGVGRNVNKF